MAISGRLSRPASLLFKSIFTSTARTQKKEKKEKRHPCKSKIMLSRQRQLTWPRSSCKNILPPSGEKLALSLAFADFAEIFTTASYHNHKISLGCRCSGVRAKEKMHTCWCM
jgi:hypothetical protein